jgi:hypothetical protein
MEYGGTRVRQSDLFGTQDAVVKITKTFFKVSMFTKTVSFDFHCCIFVTFKHQFIWSECMAHYTVKYCGRATFVIILYLIWK